MEIESDVVAQIMDHQAFHLWEQAQYSDVDDEPLDLPEVPLHAETLTAFIRLVFPSDRITAAGLRVAMKRIVVIAACIQPELGRQSL